MRTIKPIVAPFMALVMALFFMATTAHASGIAITGYHDDGVGSDGKHYYEIYFLSGDSHVDCDPSVGTDGYIDVYFDHAQEFVNGQWVLAGDVTESWRGQSGFSIRECQENMAAPNGAGSRKMFFSWYLNGVLQAGQPTYTLTF